MSTEQASRLWLTWYPERYRQSHPDGMGARLVIRDGKHTVTVHETHPRGIGTVEAMMIDGVFSRLKARTQPYKRFPTTSITDAELVALVSSVDQWAANTKRWS